MTTNRKTRLLVRPVVGFALLLTTTAASAQNIRDDVRRSFNMGNTPSVLVVRVSGADINVRATQGTTMGLVIERVARTSSRERALELFDDVETDISRNGNTVTVTIKRRPGFLSWNDRVQIAVAASVPVSTTVDLGTSGGDVRIAGTGGGVKVTTSGGDVDLAGVRGHSTVRTSGGDISVAQHQGNLTLRTSGGDVEARQIAGNVTATTSGGDVGITAVRGTIQAKTSGGDIRLAGAIAGGSARTSGGDLRLDLTTSLSAPLSLESSGSSASIRVGRGAAFDLDARAGGGRVRLDVPVTMQGNISRDHIRGRVNGGGQLLTVKISGGSVTVRPLE